MQGDFEEFFRHAHGICGLLVSHAFDVAQLESGAEFLRQTVKELVNALEFFLVFHLVDWNLTDENGKKVELKFDPNKALSDESLKLIYTLPNTLLDVVLTTYEKKMSL